MTIASATFLEDHVLRDGTRVALRSIRPSDAEELHRGFLALSPESRYRRFFSAAADLDEATLRYLTDVDGVEHGRCGGGGTARV